MAQKKNSKPLIEEKLEGEYLFKFQFFIHECSLTKDFFNIGKPAVAIRFLDFPTLIIEGKIQENGTLKIQSGKKCNFKMHSEDLRLALRQKPFFVMFVDANPTNIQMIAASNVSLALFQEDSAFLEVETQNLNLRRNFIYLYDHMKNEVMKLDATIGVSLLERGEQEKLQEKLERIHPIIPNAKIGDQDRAALHMQQFNHKNDTNKINNNGKVQVHFQTEENDDPNIIIKQNKKDNQLLQQQQNQKQLTQSQQFSKRSGHNTQQTEQEISDQVNFDNNINENINFYKTPEELEKEKLLQRIDHEHRYAINKQKQDSSLQKLLEQPFQPPPMFYERKAKPLPEKALILKQQAKLQKGTKQQQMEVVKEALTVQQERFVEELEQKQKIIKHQQDMLARQNQLIQQQIQEKTVIAQDIEAKKQDKDYIQLNDIEKIRGLAPTDRYNVLEFLIKELIQLKAMDIGKDSEGGENKRRRRRHNRKHRKRRHISSYDSEYDSEDDSKSQISHSGSKKHKSNKKKNQQKTRNTIDSNHLMPPQQKRGSVGKSPKGSHNGKRKGTVDIINTEEDVTVRDEVGKLESISVDDNDQVVHTSRKEWEEELTSTQQLGISVSMRKKDVDTSLRASQQKQYIEPTVKLQNFVAADALKSSNNSNKFNSIANRKVSDEYDDDEFESLSKSQVAVSMSLNMKKNKHNTNNGEDDSYSNEFESFGDSKTLSNEATVICFMCKQQIPKSQALQHNKTCTKVQISSTSKSSKKASHDNGAGGHNRKYSPIREHEDEEAQSVKGSSQSSKKKKHQHNGVASSSDNYSSYRFDESEKGTGKSSALSKNQKQFYGGKDSSLKKDYMRESYMSSSVSTEKPGVALFAKQVQEFMAGGGSSDDSDYESSADKKKKASSSITNHKNTVAKTSDVTSVKATVMKTVSSAGTSKQSSGKNSAVKKFKSPDSDDDEDDDSDEEEQKDDDSDDEGDDNSDEDSSSLSKSAGGGAKKAPGELGSITQMYEKYKKMQELLSKYNNGDYEESATISMSK